MFEEQCGARTAEANGKGGQASEMRSEAAGRQITQGSEMLNKAVFYSER